MTTLEKILKADLCTGCGLCISLAPEYLGMTMDDRGYLRPYVLKSLSPTLDAEILKFCPGINLNLETNGASSNTLWGPLIEARTGNAADPEMRFQGASGGAISAILLFLLETGRADYVVHIAASRMDPLANEVVISRDRADVLKAAGSRYAPAAPLVEVLQILADNPGLVVFVGKPCDIAALRSLAASDRLLKERIVCYIAFFCAGVPSIFGTYQILKTLGIHPDDVLHFQYRGCGWPGKTVAHLKDGSSHEMDYETSWGTILNRSLQFRCKICPDGCGEFADISCADAWSSHDGYPDFQEREGRSLILSRTVHGEHLITQAMNAGTLQCDATDLLSIEKMQPYQVTRKSQILARILAMRLMGRDVPEFHGLRLWECTKLAGWISFFSGFFGMVFRLLKSRICPKKDALQSCH
ncbi:MAG: Coenzyme F420 hydrogenase/dehydrogenase, beta subunit C-terminal domain [Desulfobulbaceae bacterium]|nr:Coenzyme F420 hydrogenase/dehydrogenase, beta subunit C-terminal domain [Desulfobulbaceae bacterium]